MILYDARKHVIHLKQFSGAKSIFLKFSFEAEPSFTGKSDCPFESI